MIKGEDMKASNPKGAALMNMSHQKRCYSLRNPRRRNLLERRKIWRRTSWSWSQDNWPWSQWSWFEERLPGNSFLPRLLTSLPRLPGAWKKTPSLSSWNCCSLWNLQVSEVHRASDQEVNPPEACPRKCAWR